MSNQLIVFEGRWRDLDVPDRAPYIWPSELELMAELAGLRLRERWGGWRNEPFEPTDWCILVFEPARA